MSTTVNVHIGRAIKSRLVELGCRPAWLAAQINCDRTNIFKIFGRQSIDTALLYSISQALNYNFFSLYSAGLESVSHIDERRFAA